MGNNKVVFAGETLVDLTEDTVTPGTLLEGVTAHGADGEVLVGTLNLRSVQCTLPAAGWQEEAGRFTQSVDVDWMTEDWKPGIPVLETSGNDDQDLEMLEESSCIHFIVSTQGRLTFACMGPHPTGDMTLTVPRIFT